MEIKVENTLWALRLFEMSDWGTHLTVEDGQCEIQVNPGHAAPGFGYTYCLSMNHRPAKIITVGIDWLKANLTKEEWASYVAYRLIGK